MKHSVIWLLTILLIIGYSSCKNLRKIPVPPTPLPDKEVTFPQEDSVTITPPIPPPAPSPTTNAFSSPEIIKKAQILLYLNEYVPGRVDGNLKEQTLKAIQNFQENNQLPLGDLSMTTLQAIGVPNMDFEVKDMQSSLEKKGYDPGPIDNLIGPMTRSAYLQFLKDHKLPHKGLSQEAKTALLSDDPKFNNPAQINPLFFADSTATAPPVIPDVAIQNVSVSDVLEALKAHGYDPGPIEDSLTLSAKDALFQYQVDFELPIGEINEETLIHLGFK